MARVVMSARKAKAKRRGQKRAGKKTMLTFDKRVQAVISRNIEDKYTNTKLQYQPVVAIDVNGLYTWATFFPSAQADPGGIWNFSQGTGNALRVGNKIKVKRWLIKGMIQPALNIDPGSLLGQSTIGYVTVYLGRLNAENVFTGQNLMVTADLHNLLQQGNTSVTPIGAAFESMYATNTDRYKVYAKKTFKVGQSFSVAAAPQNISVENNDFSLTARFTFDVTKYVFKNRHVTYDDNNPIPQNFDMGSLCCWCTWQPAIGSVAQSPGDAQFSFYQVQFFSYGMYEDA